MLNLTLPVLMVKPTTKPIRSRPGRRAVAKVEPNIFRPGVEELVASTLPRIDGSGLSTEEWFKINGAANRVKADVVRDMPEVTDAELHAVGERAATDALRSVLKARPAATDPNRDNITVTADPSVIPGADPEMTAEELAELEELNRLNPSGAIEANLGSFPAFDRWPAFVSNFYWADTPAETLPVEPEPRLSLVELVEYTARRFRALDNGFGDLVADRLDRLAREVHATSATCPDMVDARLSVLDRDYVEHAAAWEPELNSAGVLA